MSRDLKIKVGVEIDSTKTKMQLESALSSLQKNKFKIGFDIDTKSLNTLKQTLEGFKNIKFGISTKEVGNATKNVSASIKDSNKSLNEQKQIYSQLSKLQNEEYSILKKSVGASGEYKATLDSQLQKVREKQTLLTSQLSTSEKGLQSEQKALQLAEQKLRKERELEQVKSKNKDAMQKEVDNALKNMNTKNLSTKQVEEYRRQLEGINQVSMSQVKSQIQAINKEFDSQRNKLSDIAKMSNELGGIFSTVGEGLLKAFAAPAAGLAYSTKVVMDFGQGVANVSAISGATGADLQALEDKAKELGRTTVWSAVESTDALKYMG